MTQLCFDFDKLPVTAVALPSAETALQHSDGFGIRSLRGRTAYHSGALAEASVCDRYCHEGYEVLEKRWRGKAGEIDLIFQKDGIVVFVEVKSARDFASAAERISRRQMDRICRAACEFCATLPDGQMTNMRMDAAMVDRFGRIEVIENAFGWQ